MPKMFKSNPQTFIICLLFFLAFFLRLLLIFNSGFEADISFWKSWGLGVLDHGIVWASHHTNNNYPSPFAYVLGIMVWFYSLFADSHNFNEFWSNGNYLFLIVSKLPSILADFGIAGIIFWIGKNAKRLNFPSFNVISNEVRYPLKISHRQTAVRSDKSIVNFYSIIALIYLLNPVSLIDGAWWGQVDSLGVFVFLLALVAALVKKPMLAGALFMAAMMTKLQNMIYGPVFFLFLWEYLGYDALIRSLAGAALAFFGLNVEFLLARDMRQVVSSLTVNFDYFPYLSLNAFNLWWIVAGAAGMQISDKLLSLGLINSKTIGLLIFSSFYLFAVLKLLFSSNSTVKKKNATIQQYNNLTIENEKYRSNLLRNFFESLIIVNAAFFLYETQSHDRYAYPISVFGLLLAPFLISQYKVKFKTFIFCYLAFSLVYFYNLHTALVFNYPHNGLPVLSLLTQPLFTIIGSGILLAFFAGFIWFVIRKTNPIVYLTPISLIALMVTMLNLPLFTKNPVSLTKFTPYISQQDYGQLQTNLPLNAGFDFKNWSPLSDQYFFYQKGFGTHANSQLSFDLGGHFKKLTTDYGIDTEAGDQALAIFEIYGDGQKLFVSDKIGRYDPPRHAEVNIAGVKILSLETHPGRSSINDDHTDWLNPILWP